ncbi:capsular polysaccharide synthesis protein (plasmid) [Sphingobium sp. V4]|uniref:capsular polysaccharide synthesis protein n=1 Tax=Sphingobium sp. V4 TaxID=3038927 RepID=UPI002557FA8F|nr:capsular polysaccharide synthesis protein [Sphingobium sp. V4]WIW91142.1 capsular polysaccharide synthesis protein [Sphingobium sp. V4]
MSEMPKIIWCCWFQGREQAPHLVRSCLHSWEARNPGWEVRCLDRHSVARYAPALTDFDLNSRSVTAASLSDIVRLSLLHEYGGVWVDATVFCNRPLDEWLPGHMAEGFFAFDRPDRPLASWFLAAAPYDPVIARWFAAAMDYWENRSETDDYFWVHNLFGALLATDAQVAARWARVRGQSALPPHQIQDLGMLTPAAEAAHLVDWSLPMFKLTYRYPEAEAADDCLLHRLIGAPDTTPTPPPPTAAPQAGPRPMASISVGTENLGDHVQIIAAQRLLARHGLTPDLYVNRDTQLADPPPVHGPLPILMNGWFKSGNAGWPPHPSYAPIFLGFHIRLFQSPALLSEESLAHYRAHGPIGCRDDYTAGLLADHGIDSFVSHCLSLSLPRRITRDGRDRIFVVSRDEQLAQVMPPDLGVFTSILHYSGDHDFARNMARAEALLARYRDEAGLIVTSLLHCALPAIAMGIPVIMFHPPASPAGRQSDMERFSALARLIPIHDVADMAAVDWSPEPVDVGAIKLAMIDRLGAALAAQGLGQGRAVGPIAPSSILPPGARKATAA